MKITIKNYFRVIRELNQKNLPDALIEAHKTITETTASGTNWTQYERNKEFKRVTNLAFKRLEEFLSANHLSGTSTKDKNNNPYSKISEECHFINLFLSFHNKVVYKNTFGIFIDELQKAIDEKLIRKTSPVAKDIMAIQDAAVKQFNTMQSAKYFVLKPATITRLNTIVATWENSFADEDDSYAKEKRKSIGLQGIAQPVVEAAPPEPPPQIMTSEEFTKTKFETIGLTGKWLRLIGDPSPGFKAMVFGMPKMGKSYLCVDFASYLSKNHGKVLYISKEEFLSPTLALKLKDKDAANPNLDIAGTVPPDLSAYHFVFLDSVTSLKLTPDDLKALEAKYPTISFIYVFQVTKAGSARGTNEYMHNVDVVIEIPEKGKAVQFGRFNQGGEMDIFTDDSACSTTNFEANALFGLSGKPKKDWTEGEHVNEADKYYLKQIKKCVDEGRMAEAMDWASRGDTDVREAIPGEIWLKMGGTLTNTGWEKLRKRGFTEKEIKQLRDKSEGNEEPEEEEEDAPIREISLLPSSKPRYQPPLAEIYNHANRLWDINYALRGLKADLESQVIKKFRIPEYLDIVKITVRKHPDLFQFTEDVSAGLRDILFRLQDSYEDWKNGVTPDTVKPKPYKPREGVKIHFPPSPGLDALAIYYDRNVKNVGSKKFSEILTDAVEKDDLLYYNLHDLERVFSRVLGQIKNATKKGK